MKLGCTLVFLLAIVAISHCQIDFSSCDQYKRPSSAFVNKVFNATFLTAQYMTEVRKIFIETVPPNPLLLNPNTNVFIQLLSNNATIDITYVLSITSSKNSFGYFVYDPATLTYKSNPGLAVIYPLLKDVYPVYGPNGCLYPGYTVTLGPFSSGTIIGFFIYVNAWSSSSFSFGANPTTWYSMTSSVLKNRDTYKHVSWATVGDKTVVGFEDGSLGDADYNDVMFTFGVNGLWNQTVVSNFTDGFIQGCIEGSVITYAQYNCFTYTLLENSNALGCQSFIRIPSGYMIAPYDSNTIDAVKAAGSKFAWTGTTSSSYLLTAGSNCILPNGNACSGGTINTYSADSQCVGAACSYRILLRSTFVTSSGCTNLENNFCDPNVGSASITRDPFASAVNKSVDPTTWTAYVVPSNAQPRITLPVNIFTWANSRRPLDILFVADFNGVTATEWDNFKTQFTTFTTNIQAAFPVASMQLGYAILRQSTVDVSSLSSAVSTQITAFKAVSLGTTFTSSTSNIHSNLASLITRSGMGWRSLTNAGGLSVVVVITKATPASSGVDTLASVSASYNVVPLFIAGSSVSGSFASLSLPFYNSYSHVFPTFSTNAVNAISWAASKSAVTAIGTLSSQFVVSVPATITPAVGAYTQVNLTLGWPSPAPANYVSPSTLSYVIWGYNVVSVKMIANLAPTITTTTFFTDEDTSLTFSLSSVFADSQSNKMKFAFTSLPSSSVGTLLTSGSNVAANTWYDTSVSFTLNPFANYNGNVNLNLLVTDGCENTTGVVAVTIRPVNDPPTAVAFGVTMIEDEPDLDKRTINFASYINDIDGTTPTVTIVSLPSRGTLTYGQTYSSTVSSNTNIPLNLVRYAPPANWNGVTTFTYFAIDSSSATSATVTVTITVTPVNDPPTSNSITVTTNEDTALVIDQISGSDVDGDSLTLYIFSTVAKGTLTMADDSPLGTLPALVSSGKLKYTPPLNQNGSPFTTFTFKLYDGQAYSPEYTGTINVLPVNDAPIGSDFTITTPEDTTVTISFVTRIYDIDTTNSSLIVTVRSLGDSSLGSLKQTSASTSSLTSATQLTQQSVHFTPVAEKTGSYYFTYDVYDGSLRSTSYTVTVVVTPVNDAPTLTTTASVVISDRDVTTTFPLYIRDFDIGDTLTTEGFSLNVTSTFGTVNVVSGTTIAPSAQTTVATYNSNDGTTKQLNIAWTPSSTAPDNLNGAVSFQVTDAAGATSAVVTVFLRVSANKVPVIWTPAAIVTPEDTTYLNYRVEAYDPDSTTQGTALTGYIATLPQHGTLVSNGVDYTTVGVALSTRQTTTNTTFYLVNYRPNLNYNGPDSFYFYFVDTLSGTSSVQLVDITVTPVNDQPITNSFSVTIDEDTTATLTQFAVTDVDVGDTFTLVITSVPAKGTLLRPVGDNTQVAVNNEFAYSNAASWQLRYNPVANDNGSPYTSFKFRIRDNSGAGNAFSDEKNVTINVLPINDAPVATPVSLTTAEDTAKTFLWTSYISDPDNVNTDLKVVVTSVPSNGQLQITTDGTTWTTVTQGQVISVTNFNSRYVPSTNFNGEDTFNWYVRDPAGLTSISTGTITVTPVNDPPTSQNQKVSTTRTEAVDITNWVVNDIDTLPASIKLIVLSLPEVGTLSQDDSVISSTPYNAGTSPNSAVLTWTPPDLRGIKIDSSVPFASFNFKLNDGELDSPSNYTVDVYILFSNTPPSSQRFVTTIEEDTVATITLSASDLESLSEDLTIKITSIASSTVGTFYYNSELTQEVQVGDFLPNKTRTFYYKPPANANSANGLPLASFTFQVLDTDGSYSDVYDGLIFVTPINDPSTYDGAATLSVYEDNVLNINLGSQITDIDSTGETSIVITSTVSRGKLYVCTATETSSCVETLVKVGDTLTGTQRQVMFLPFLNENGDNYATFGFQLLDSDNLLSATYTITINVIPVNDPPVLTPFYNVLPERVVMFEDTTQVLEWKGSDIDSDISKLVAIITSQVPTNAKLFNCDVTDGAYCNQGEELTIPATLSSQFNNGTWRVLFVPDANAYDDRNFATFVVTLEDDAGAESNIARSVIRVRPVNDAPVIGYASLDLTVNTDTDGASRTALSSFSVSDIDAGKKLIVLTILAEQDAGVFSFGSSLNDVPCTIEANNLTCKAKQTDLNVYLSNLFFSSNITTQTTLTISVDDLGNTDWNNTALTDVVVARILYSIDTGLITTPETDNTLTIAVSVSAAAAAAAAGIIIWRMKKKNAGIDDYFENLNNSIQTGSTNPMYQAAYSDAANPLYKAKDTA
jgi:hypothetical protein